MKIRITKSDVIGGPVAVADIDTAALSRDEAREIEALVGEAVRTNPHESPTSDGYRYDVSVTFEHKTHFRSYGEPGVGAKLFAAAQKRR